MAKKNYGGSRALSGPTKASGHVDSIMGREYPGGATVRGNRVVATSKHGKRSMRSR